MSKENYIPGVGKLTISKRNVRMNIEDQEKAQAFEKALKKCKLSPKNEAVIRDFVQKKLPVTKISEKYSVSRNWVYVLHRRLLGELNNLNSEPIQEMLFKTEDFAFAVFPSVIEKMNHLLIDNAEQPYINDYRKGMIDAITAFGNKELTAPLNSKEGGKTKLQRYRHGYNAIFNLIHGITH